MRGSRPGLLLALGLVAAPAMADKWVDRMDAATVAWQQKDLATAEREARTALALAEGSKKKDIRLAESLSLLAEILRSRGAAAEAEPLYQRALSHTETTFGPDAPETARIASNFGTFQFQAQKLPEAQALYERALGIQERAGREDSQTAQYVHNLGSANYTQGRYPEAEGFFRRALALREKLAAGAKPGTKEAKEAKALQPKIAQTLQSLGWALWRQKRNDEAEALFRRALSIWEAEYGPDDPRTAAGLDEWALFLEKTGRADQAQSVRARAQAIRAKRP